MILGGLGNILTLVAIPYARVKYGSEFSLLQLNSTILILNLSIADLLYCLVGFPHFIQVLISLENNWVLLSFISDIFLQNWTFRCKSMLCIGDAQKLWWEDWHSFLDALYCITSCSVLLSLIFILSSFIAFDFSIVSFERINSHTVFFDWVTESFLSSPWGILVSKVFFIGLTRPS